MIDSMMEGGIALAFKIDWTKGGGSSMIPLPLIQIIYPEVDPLGSKPCEFPRVVTPKYGGSKGLMVFLPVSMFFKLETVSASEYYTLTSSFMWANSVLPSKILKAPSTF